MLHRHVLGYAPATLVPALASFATIYVFTRLLSPAEFGSYAVVASVALMWQLIGFSWLQTGTTRFVARAGDAGGAAGLGAAAHRAFALVALLFSLGYALVLWLYRFPPHLSGVLWLGLPLVLARSFTSLNQAFHRGSLRVARYNVIECGQALLGLLLGVLLVGGFGFGAAGILLGLIAGSAVMGLVDLPAAAAGLRARPAPGQVRGLLRYGLPLTASTTLDFVMSSADRLLIEYFVGPAAVGLYAVAYGVMDRALSAVFTGISLATFPMVVRALERDGPEAARRQTYQNGTVLLAVAIPACAGLIMGNRHIAMVLVGESFRDPARAMMPWIALSAFLCGLQQHYFSQSFHLSARTEMFVVASAPAAIAKIALNLWLLPRVGVMGAVYATVACYALAALGSLAIGQRLFRMSFPFGPLLRIAGATSLMIAVLAWARFPPTRLGLLLLVVTGGATYAVGAWLLDVGDARRLLRERLRGRAAV